VKKEIQRSFNYFYLCIRVYWLLFKGVGSDYLRSRTTYQANWCVYTNRYVGIVLKDNNIIYNFNILYYDMVTYIGLLKFSKLKLNHCYAFILNTDIKHGAFKSYKLLKSITTIRFRRITGYNLLGNMQISIISFSWV